MWLGITLNNNLDNLPGGHWIIWKQVGWSGIILLFSQSVFSKSLSTNLVFSLDFYVAVWFFSAYERRELLDRSLEQKNVSIVTHFCISQVISVLSLLECLKCSQLFLYATIAMMSFKTTIAPPQIYLSPCPYDNDFWFLWLVFTYWRCCCCCLCQYYKLINPHHLKSWGRHVPARILPK